MIYLQTRDGINANKIIRHHTTHVNAEGALESANLLALISLELQTTPCGGEHGMLRDSSPLSDRANEFTTCTDGVTTWDELKEM